MSLGEASHRHSANVRKLSNFSGLQGIFGQICTSKGEGSEPGLH